MKSVQINLSNKLFYTLIALAFVFIVSGIVLAYTNPGQTANPAIHGHTADEIEGAVGGGSVKMAAGTLLKGEIIPLPAGVTDAAKCVWQVSLKKLAGSGAAPAMHSTGAYADANRVVHMACEPSNCAAYTAPSEVSYIIICNS